ncbi:hypothetical protein GCM10011494_03040 [Novosphingobium endophyticum]|uniref:Alg9-like mannosyltransferase family protein n=1 Tax=Novosphingobium endophyticum TaxID=1955250 RepID=A0A916TPM7_9SPHN|nr:hypothetical protein [Novosphingobium endophyticum]GGB88129.1 hypothetical protein GCM10011494_03040 [Novosphingobium endophyticum]
MGNTGGIGARGRGISWQSNERTWQLAILAIVALAVVLRVHAFSPFDISHADELMQYLEQANRIATGHGIRPWETRYGVRNELIPQLLSLPFWIGHRIAPGTLAGMYLARVTFAALTLIALPAAWRLGALVSRRHALAALFVVAIWWESVLYSNLLLSESLGAAILLLSAAPLLDEKAGVRALRMSGFLLGLGLLVRFQFAPFAAVLFLYAEWRDRRRILPLVTGGIIAAALGAASDLARGAAPFSWVFANFTMNIGEGRAAGFGVSGPFQYLVDYYFHFGAGALIFTLLCVLLAGRRYWPLLCAAVVTVAAHSLIGHKEYRFVWIATLTLLALAAIGSLNLFRFLADRRRPGSGDGPVPLAATLAVWALLSLSSFQITGGYSAFRGGGALSKLAAMAGARPDVCRLAVVEAYYAYVAPSIMPRRVPISVAPKGVYEGTRPLPPELVIAADALLAEKRPLGTEQYRQVACLTLPSERPCLYVRPGTCTPDPVYDFQTSLERGGM